MLDADGSMSLARALASVAVAAAISVAIAVGVRSQTGLAHGVDGPTSEGALGVSWALEPASVSELAESSRALVEAEVLSAEPGTPYEFYSGDERIVRPTELIHVRVTEVLEGQAPAELTLFKVGNASTVPAGEEGVHLEGDPAYKPGQTYVLFVRRRLNDEGTGLNRDGTWLPAAPEGRLVERRDEKLHPFVDTPVAEELDGKTAEQVDRKVDEVGQ